MRFWLIGFLALFGAAELLQWVRQLSLPLPIFILGGAFLAVASNYDKLPILQAHLEPEDAEPEVPELRQPVTERSVDRPPAPPSEPARRSISFTIRKSFYPGD